MALMEEDAAYWREAVPVIRGIYDEMDDMCSHLPAVAVNDETLAKIAEWRDRLVVVCP